MICDDKKNAMYLDYLRSAIEHLEARQRQEDRSFGSYCSFREINSLKNMTFWY